MIKRRHPHLPCGSISYIPFLTIVHLFDPTYDGEDVLVVVVCLDLSICVWVHVKNDDAKDISKMFVGDGNAV